LPFKATLQWLAILLIILTIGCAHRSQSSSAVSGMSQQLPSPIPAAVVSISEEYANINTDLSENQLAAYGITHGSNLVAHYNEQTIQALLGRDYSDVPRGAWIALIEEDGTLQLAISFGNAATQLGCAAGDTLYIEPLVHRD